MTAPPGDLAAWLGPAADDLTPDQVDRLAGLARRIAEFYPHPDEDREREAALSTAVQHLLDETTAEEVRRTLIAAALAEHDARVAATWLGVCLVNDGMKKAAAARAVGIDRMLLLEALGERPRRRKPRP